MRKMAVVYRTPPDPGAMPELRSYDVNRAAIGIRFGGEAP
jgi:hypothetical protein